MFESETAIGRLRHTVRLMKEDGLGLQGQKIDFSQFIAFPPNEAADLLRHRLANQISGLSILDKEGPLGIFNRHDSQHIESVNRIAHTLLDKSESFSGIPVSTKERNIASAISYLHDLGNNIERNQHAEISARLVRKIFSNYDESDPAFRSVVLGIRLHNEPEGMFMHNFSDLSSMDPPVYPRPIWAMIAADKLDVGRHRLSSALHDRLPVTFEQIIEQTPHTLVILYAQKSSFALSDDGTAGAWNIEFSTNVDNERDIKTKRILDQFIWKNKDMYVPKRWHENWRDHDIPYSVSYLGNMRMLYCTRLALMLSCLYSLFPQLETLQINVQDPKTYIHTEVSSTFRREDWQEVLFMIWKKKNRKSYRAESISVPPILDKGEKDYKERKGYTV